MQERPVCFGCDEAVDDPVSMVFEAPCGHDTCPSAVFHGLCLMEWREKGRDNMRRFSRFIGELLGRAREMGVAPPPPPEET